MKDINVLKERLQSWKDEKSSNKNGLKHLADRAITVIENDISYIKTGKYIHKQKS